MMSLTFGLFTQVSGSGPLGPLVTPGMVRATEERKNGLYRHSSLCGIKYIRGKITIGTHTHSTLVYYCFRQLHFIQLKYGQG